MDIEVTLNDPAVYARPWTMTLRAELHADTELLESVCNEGAQKSLENWVGKASEERSSEVKVARDKLVTYAGTYVEQDLWGPGPHPRIINITVSGDTLIAELSDRGKIQLGTQSDTTFSGFFGWSLIFVTDSQGVVTHLIERHISGGYRYAKKK